MFTQFKNLQGQFPRQFWLLFWGMMLNSIGSSMIWPFLMIYISEKLHLGLTVAASMMTINAVMGLISSFVTGPIADSLGRKWIMVISLAVNALSYLLLSMANSLPLVALSMAITGTFNPLYRVGADSMMADLVPPEKRADAYSMLRMSNNIGISIGPAIGGFVATISYNTAFYIASSGMMGYSLLLFIFARETLPNSVHRLAQSETLFKKLGKSAAGYPQVLRDKPFVFSTIAFLLNQFVATLIWVMMSVYTKQQYKVPESQYGFIPTTNALMVVFLQLAVTQVTKKRPPLRMMALGAFLYMIAVASVTLGRNFWGFWISMVIMTFGELILVPTSTTYVANLAPADMRGRYMSLYSLSGGIATGTSPLLGGFLSDNLGPSAMWYGGAVVGLMSTSLFFLLSRRSSQKAAV